MEQLHGHRHSQARRDLRREAQGEEGTTKSIVSLIMPVQPFPQQPLCEICTQSTILNGIRDLHNFFAHTQTHNQTKISRKSSLNA